MKIILKKSLTLALMDIGMMDQLFNELQQEPLSFSNCLGK